MVGPYHVGGRGCRIGELAAGAAGQLAAGARGPADGLGDLVERDREHVVQDERHPLPRRQPVQHLQQRGVHLVVQGHAVGGVAFGCDVVFGPQHRLEPDPRRPELIEAQPAGDDGQPTPDVVERRLVGAGQPQERLLRDVLGLTDVAEHLVGEIHQVGPVISPRGGDVAAREGRIAHACTTNRRPEKLQIAMRNFSPPSPVLDDRHPPHQERTMIQSVVVTGATGNVGRPLVTELAEAGVEVRAITRHPETADFPPGVTSFDSALDGHARRRRGVPELAGARRRPGRDGRGGPRRGRDGDWSRCPPSTPTTTSPASRPGSAATATRRSTNSPPGRAWSGSACAPRCSRRTSPGCGRPRSGRVTWSAARTRRRRRRRSPTPTSPPSPRTPC